LASPLARSVATPGHISQMQRIFQDAKASLKLDAAIANAPAGSMASKLSGTGTSCEITSTRTRHTTGSAATGGKHSTAPQGPAEADLGAGDSFPAGSPRLPCHDLTQLRHWQTFPREPISSGFTSPVAPGDGDVAMEGDSPLPPAPGPTPSKGGRSTVSLLQRSNRCQVPVSNIASTELDQPMTKMHVSHNDVWPNGTPQDSPNARRGRRRCSKTVKIQESDAHDVVDFDIDGSDGHRDIVLSTPVRAAAESAKLKRELLGYGVRAASNTEDVGPQSVNVSQVLPSCTPTIHFLGVHGEQIALPPNLAYGSMTPNPYQQIQLPPVPETRRNDSTNSPFPILEVEPTQPRNGISPQQQWRGYYSPAPRELFASPPQQPRTSPPYHQQKSISRPSRQYHTASPSPQHHPFFEPTATFNRFPPSIPSSQQNLVCSHCPPLSPLPDNARCPQAPDTPRHSFSTAAAAQSRSSPTPDSRIRDTYGTDTLTPIEAPTARFREIGLDAAAQFMEMRRCCSLGSCVSDHAIVDRGPSRSVSDARRLPSCNDRRVGLSRAITSGARKYYAHMQTQGRVARPSPELTFRSSPPRPIWQFRAAQRRKKIRRSFSAGEGLSPATEEDGPFCMPKAVEFGVSNRRGVEVEGMSGRKAEGIHEIHDHATASVGQLIKGQDSHNGKNGRTPSIKAICGSERMLFGKKATTTQQRIAMPSTPSQRMGTLGKEQKDGGEEVRELSPYVTAYRKGRGPQVRDGERRPSYWDGDILALGKQGRGEDLGVGGGGGELECDKENLPPNNGVNEDDEGQDGDCDGTTDAEMVDAVGVSTLPAVAYQEADAELGTR
jgi:hypothetical protein